MAGRHSRSDRLPVLDSKIRTNPLDRPSGKLHARVDHRGFGAGYVCREARYSVLVDLLLEPYHEAVFRLLNRCSFRTFDVLFTGLRHSSLHHSPPVDCPLIVSYLYSIIPFFSGLSRARSFAPFLRFSLHRRAPGARAFRFSG